jgi:hypothetical protein
MKTLIIVAVLTLSLTAAESAGQTAADSISIKGTQLDVDVYGNIIVLDTERNIVRLYSKDRILLRELGGSGWENDQFDRPAGLWARNGIDIFVADYGNHRIQRFDRKLNFISTFSTRESSNPDERFGYPTAVALSRLGDLYICDGENSRILKVNRFTQVERVFGGFDAGKGRLQHPSSLQMGPKDHVYVLDGKRIVVFDSFGNYVHDFVPGLFAAPSCFFADGVGIVILDAGTLYCFDEGERPVGAVPIASLAEKGTAIRALAINAKLLYLLTESGLVVIPDQCSVEQEKSLDK